MDYPTVVLRYSRLLNVLSQKNARNLEYAASLR